MGLHTSFVSANQSFGILLWEEWGASAKCALGLQASIQNARMVLQFFFPIICLAADISRHGFWTEKLGDFAEHQWQGDGVKRCERPCDQNMELWVGNKPWSCVHDTPTSSAILMHPNACKLLGSPWHRKRVHSRLEFTNPNWPGCEWPQVSVTICHFEIGPTSTMRPWVGCKHRKRGPYPRPPTRKPT